MVEVVALAGALADTGEHLVAAVLRGDVADQFLDQHRLAHAGAAEQPDLAAALIRRQQIDDLDAGLEDLLLGLLLVERRGGPVDRQPLGGLGIALLVDRLAEQVEDAAEARLTHRHRDRAAGVMRLHAAHQAVGRAHGDAADDVVAHVQRGFDCELDVA